MNPISHVVWDWNGTLLDDFAATHWALNEVLASVDRAAVEREYYRTRFVRPIRGFYEGLFGRGLTDDEWETLDDRFHEQYRLRLARIPLAADAREAIALARGAGLTQSILSMWHHDELGLLVASLGLREYFDRVDGSRGGRGDTKEGRLAAHLTALDLDPECVVLVGDTLDDAAAAKAAGVRCVLYEGGINAPEVLAQAGPTAPSLCEAVRIAVSASVI